MNLLSITFTIFCLSTFASEVLINEGKKIGGESSVELTIRGEVAKTLYERLPKVDNKDLDIIGDDIEGVHFGRDYRCTKYVSGNHECLLNVAKPSEGRVQMSLKEMQQLFNESNKTIEIINN